MVVGQFLFPWSVHRNPLAPNIGAFCVQLAIASSFVF